MESECREVLRRCRRDIAYSRLVAWAASNGLAYALTQQGRHTEAEEVARQALRDLDQSASTLVRERLDVVFHAALARALNGQGRHEEALDLLDTGLASAKVRHTEAGVIELVRAVALSGLGRHAEAEAEARLGLQEMQGTLGSGHGRIMQARKVLDEIATRTRGL